MIDTHCHLTYPGIIERLPDVLAAAVADGVDRMISVATHMGTARQAIAIAHAHAGVFATVGVHPHDAASSHDMAEMAELAGDSRIVALGEMGLDTHYPEPALSDQQALFEAQLVVAAKTDLPIVIHNRKATDRVLATLRESGIAGERFVFHCFTGDASELRAILNFGAMVSFTGIITFRNAADLAAASDMVPLQRLMVETDSPYLTPEPHRKVKTNEPRYVRAVARFLAKRRQMSEGAFVQEVDANACRFFRLPQV